MTMRQKKSKQFYTPRWMHKEEECVFCGKYSPISDIKVAKDQSHVQVTYVCRNDKCELWRRIRRRSKFKMEYQSEGWVKDYLSEGKESPWAKFDEEMGKTGEID